MELEIEKKKKIIALKDFEIHHNDVHILIKKGDEISEKNVPKIYWVNLKTEKVI